MAWCCVRAIGKANTLAQINIERLSLKLSGVAEGEGQRLARLIAEGLGVASVPIDSSRHLDAIRLRVTARPGTSADELSRQIVADLLRQLARSI